MRAAPSGFANDGGAFQYFQIVGELFAAGKSFFGGQDEGRLAVEALAGNVGQSPILVGDVTFAGPKIVEVGALGEQIGGEERDHFGIAATVFAQVEDDRVDVGEKVHGGDGGWPADFGFREEIEF